jgi:ketosteroid isomerase-like protein
VDSPRTPLETVKALWAAWDARGPEGVLDFVHPDTEWIPQDGQVVRGREEMEAYLADLRERRIQLEPRPYSFEPVGDCVIVAGGLRTRTPNGLSDVQRHWLYRVEHGRLVHIETLSSRDEALKRAELVCQAAA